MSDRNGQTTYYPGASQNVSYTGSNAQSSVTNKNTTIVRLIATTNARVTFENRSAVATDMLLVAGVPEYFSIKGLQQVNVIQDSASGSLNVVEMTQ